MNKWKNFIETVAAVKEVVATMVKQIRNPNFPSMEVQGLKVMLLPTLDKIRSDASFSTLELTPSGFENWERFPMAAVEITKKLLSSFCVLTAVRVFPSGSSKKSEFYPFRSQEEVFLHTYAELLRLQGRSDNVHYQNPSNIITATHGANVPLTAMLFSGDYGIGFDYHAYGFATQPPSADTLQAKNSIERESYTLHLTYERYPDTLEICTDTELFPVSQCLTAIQDVCAGLSIPLEVDPTLK